MKTGLRMRARVPPDPGNGMPGALVRVLPNLLKIEWGAAGTILTGIKVWGCLARAILTGIKVVGSYKE